MQILPEISIGNPYIYAKEIHVFYLDDYTLIKKMHDLTERYLTLDDGLSSAEKAAFLKVEIAEVAYAFYINNVFS